MVTSVRNGETSQPWAKKGNESANTRKRTRASTEIARESVPEAVATVSKLTSSNAQRKKVAPTPTPKVKGKKQVKNLSTAVVDVVYGTLKNAVPDVKELRRKREEDTVQCGRVVKAVSNVRAQKIDSKGPCTTSQEKASNSNMTSRHPCGTPVSPANVYRNPTNIGENSVVSSVRCFCGCTCLGLKNLFSMPTVSIGIHVLMRISKRKPR